MINFAKIGERIAHKKYKKHFVEMIEERNNSKLYKMLVEEEEFKQYMDEIKDPTDPFDQLGDVFNVNYSNADPVKYREDRNRDLHLQ